MVNPSKGKLREIEVARKQYAKEVVELKKQVSFITSELDDITKSLTTDKTKYKLWAEIIDTNNKTLMGKEIQIEIK